MTHPTSESLQAELLFMGIDKELSAPRRAAALRALDRITASDARIEAAVRAGLKAAAKRIVSFERGTVMHSPPQLLTDAHDQICAIAADPAEVARIASGEST